MSYVIEKGVPLPQKISGGKWNERFPFLPYMQVGDSFFIPDAHKNVYNSIPYDVAKKKWGIALTRRKVNENGIPGHRVWRIK